jgi:hypothetical protein
VPDSAQWLQRAKWLLGRDWQLLSVMQDEASARLAIKKGVFGHWKWKANKSGKPMLRYAYCNDHLDCHARLRLATTHMGCEVAVNVVDVHETVMNEKKRTNSLMTLELKVSLISLFLPHLICTFPIHPDSSRCIPIHSDSR